MDIKEKIETITEFIVAYPESTASRAIIRRHILFDNKFETSQELTIELKDLLENVNEEEIDFCYYLVK